MSDSQDVDDLQAGEVDEELGTPTEPTGTPKEDAKEPERDWDKERQDRDQVHATERKALHDRIDGLLAQQGSRDARAQELEDKIEALSQKPDEPEPELTADSDLEDFMAELKQVRKASKANAEENKSLREDLSSRDAKQAERDADDAKDRAKTDYKATVKTYADEYGAQYSAEAQKRAQEYFRAKGFDEDNTPSDTAIDLAFDKFFGEVRDEDKNRKPSGGTNPPVTLDTGAGGAADNAPQKPMNDTQFKEYMRRQGTPVD